MLNLLIEVTGCAHWIASFFIRTYDFALTCELSIWLRLIVGISGGAGTFLEGYLTENHSRHDRLWYF